MRSFIALGANLGDAAATVRAAADAVAAIPGVSVVACASLYRTAPVGLANQPDFINSVMSVDSELDAPALLAALFAIEQAFGRQRSIVNGPRTLDLDLLLHGDTTCNTPDLTLPHPRMHERAFVLAPLLEIAPDIVIPGLGLGQKFFAQIADQHIQRLSA